MCIRDRKKKGPGSDFCSMWLGDSCAKTGAISKVTTGRSMRHRLEHAGSCPKMRTFFKKTSDLIVSGARFADQYRARDSKGGHHKAGDIYQEGMATTLNKSIQNAKAVSYTHLTLPTKRIV